MSKETSSRSASRGRGVAGQSPRSRSRFGDEGGEVSGSSFFSSTSTCRTPVGGWLSIPSWLPVSSLAACCSAFLRTSRNSSSSHSSADSFVVFNHVSKYVACSDSLTSGNDSAILHALERCSCMAAAKTPRDFLKSLSMPSNRPFISAVASALCSFSIRADRNSSALARDSDKSEMVATSRCSASRSRAICLSRASSPACNSAASDLARLRAQSRRSTISPFIERLFSSADACSWSRSCSGNLKVIRTSLSAMAFPFDTERTGSTKLMSLS